MCISAYKKFAVDAKDRVLDRVELIADAYAYADIPRLFVEPPYDDGK